MRKTLKIIGLIGFTALLLTAVVVFAFYHLVRVGEFRRFLTEEIERRTDLQVRLGEAELEVGRALGISFHAPALLRPESSGPVVQADRITARVAWLPLLKRRVVFDEIRLDRPSTRMVRDREGRISVLDKLLEFPFSGREQAGFSLDLRAIRLTEAEIVFEDHRGGGEVATTRFHNLGLTLRRTRETAPQDAAVEFDLKSAIDRDGAGAALRATGKIVFPGERLDLDSARWEVQAQSTDLPGEMIRRYAGAGLPVKSIRGEFSPRIRISGSPAKGFHLEGETAFKQLHLDAPDLFAAPVTPGSGRMAWKLDWRPQRWSVPALDFQSEEINLSYKEAARSGGDDDPTVEVALSTPFLPVAALRNYVPLQVLDSPQQRDFIAALKDGEVRIRKAAIAARRSEIRRAAGPELVRRVRLDAELRGAGAEFGAGYLPLRRVQGRIALENGILSVENLKGEYGRSRWTEVRGSYRGLFSDEKSLDLRAHGEIDLEEAREQLKLEIVPPRAAKFASSIQEMGGRAKAAIVLRKVGGAPLQAEGRIVLENARFGIADLSLAAINGELSISPKEVRADGIQALLSGSPIRLRLAARDYLSDQGSFDLAVDSGGVKAGAVTRLLLESGSLQDPGTVRGSVRYRGAFAPEGERIFTGVLDLAGVQISHRPLKQPLRQLSGRLEIDEEGIDFQGLRGLIVGAPFAFSGRWRYERQPRLVFDFAAPALDIGYLISQIDEESGDWYDRLRAQGKVAIARGKYEGFEFSDLKSDVALDRRVWSLTGFTARSEGGTVQGVGAIADQPDVLGFSFEPKVQGVPVKGFFSWFEMGATEITGKVNLTGKVESSGKDGPERKKNLNGAFNLKIEDGTVRRMRILVQILNLLDLSRWFTLKMPDINKEGIRFRSITGDFKVVDGVYATENLFVDSDDLRMTGAGTIDGPNDRVDFVVAVRPFPGVDAAINFIPLIGRGIAAIKNSLLVASFNVKGAIDNPTITPAPLSTLSEVFFGVLGIPKKIIAPSVDGPQQEPKQEPKEPSKEPPNAPIQPTL